MGTGKVNPTMGTGPSPHKKSIPIFLIFSGFLRAKYFLGVPKTSFEDKTKTVRLPGELAPREFSRLV